MNPFTFTFRGTRTKPSFGSTLWSLSSATFRTMKPGKSGASSSKTTPNYWRLGMNTAATNERHSTSDVSERITDVSITDADDGKISFHLEDGRVISVPLAWSWRLQEATPEERRNYRISPSGYGVHWPDVDEDLSARGALRGTPAPRPKTSPPADESPTDWTPGRVKRLRAELGLSQQDFGERMGVRQATVSDWETGKQTPSRIARRLLDRFRSDLYQRSGAA